MWTSRLLKLANWVFPDTQILCIMPKGVQAQELAKELSDEISIDFDLEKLYIPPLTSATTKFLGLPLPPFLKIDVEPKLLRGYVDQESGKVNLEFKAKFWFSVGTIYRAPPLLVDTVLTSEESKGIIREGRGERLNEEGRCKLVGVATVEPIDDLFMNTFLNLPPHNVLQIRTLESHFPGPRHFAKQ